MPAFDWSTFTPADVATLLFVRRGLDLLLIRKRRGLGAGKINAPGGRLEPGETPEQAAIREVQEEVGVTPTSVRARGELRFAFTNGYQLHCHVFTADGCVGEARETDEALPMWVPVDQIPYDEMWADDRLWLPRMLAGYPFDGRFEFDDEQMLSQDLRLVDPAEPAFARLRALGIPHETHQHTPVFTVDQAKAVRTRHDGFHTKNLFVRNKKGAMWLVTLPEDRAVDMRALGDQLGAGHLSFGSAERLRTHLGVEPGSVSPLAAVSDTSGSVRVAIASEILAADAVHCHPLTNDRTTTLSGRDLARYLHDTGHAPSLV